MDSIFRVLQWSFAVLKAGAHPVYRHDNTPFVSSSLIGDRQRAKLSRLPLKLHGALVQMRCDWSFAKSAMGFTGWNDGPNQSCCIKCAANRVDIPFSDFYETALWRQTAMSHQLYMQTKLSRGAGDNYISAIFGIPGMQFEYLDLDLMHMGDLGYVRNPIRLNIYCQPAPCIPRAGNALMCPTWIARRSTLVFGGLHFV